MLTYGDHFDRENEALRPKKGQRTPFPGKQTLKQQGLAWSDPHSSRSRKTFNFGSTDFESWAKESFEIATKIAYRNGGRIGIPKGENKDCRDVKAAPVLPVGYVHSASRIGYRRMILAGYRLADLLMRLTSTFD